MTYQLHIEDSSGRSASWSHTNGYGGKPSLVFPDNRDIVIVLDHKSQTTYLYISPNGVMEIDTVSKE